MLVYLATENVIDAIEENTDELRATDLVRLLRIVKIQVEAQVDSLSPKAWRLIKSEVAPIISAVKAMEGGG